MGTNVDSSSQAWLDQLLAYAASLPAADREAYIRQACGDRVDLIDAAAERFKAPIPTQTIPVQARSAQMIGPYRVLRELGKGGMGIVYLAVRDDGAFRKNVAIKLLRGDAVTPEFVSRFRNERQVLANFDHPNIARILDGGDTADGMPFYVMEYVEGRPIDRYCDEEKLALNDRIRLYQKLIAAVHYLHQNQVVHRDLKPSNILVATDGTVKLLDFGIAKQLGPASMELTTAEGTPLTPAYAAPEQFTGRADARSDIYTLGVILYLLLTGRLPDQGTIKPPSETIREDYQRTQETTKQLKRRMMGDLDTVVLKAMARESRVRYATAQEFAEDLERYLKGQPVLARPRVGLHPIVLAAGLAIVLLGGGAGWYFLRPQSDPGKVEVAKSEAQVYQPAVTPAPAPPTSQPDPVIEKPVMGKTVTPPPIVTTAKPEFPKAVPVKPEAVKPEAVKPESVKLDMPAKSMEIAPKTNPTPPPPAPSTPSGAELDEARDRYANLSGRVAATEQLFNKIKADLEGKGLNIRSDTLSRVTSMKLNLALAKENIDRGNAAAADRNLSTADALANRINKELGR